MRECVEKCDVKLVRGDWAIVIGTLRESGRVSTTDPTRSVPRHTRKTRPSRSASAYGTGQGLKICFRVKSY